MKKIFKLLILGLLLFSFNSLFAQTKTVKVEGEWEISNDITSQQARQRALEQARIKALVEAGVPLNINLTEIQTMSELVSSYSHFSKSEIMGEITKEEILKEGRVEKGDRWFYNIYISATVKISKVKNECTLDAHISGLNSAYSEGDKLEFTIKPSEDCYVQIFWFDDTGNGGMMYPNELEPIQRLKAKTENTFPQSETLEYTLFKETKEDIESNYFFFVFTKKERPYNKATKDGATTLDDLYQWIIKIPSDQRVTKQEAIFIGKKGK
jgi:hypothetical protein